VYVSPWDGSLSSALLVRCPRSRPRRDPRPALADPRTAFLVEQLKSSDDYRVRTQAALALGAS
jgi:hypothetical protein